MSGLALPHDRSLLRRYLLAGYVLMIVYASLSPFAGWQMPVAGFLEVLTSPQRPTYTAFDAIANCAAYLPLGLLLALTLHTRFRPLACVELATLAAVSLSLSMEYLQMYLPMRASASVDVLTNGLGALCGARLGAAVVYAGAVLCRGVQVIAGIAWAFLRDR